MLRLRELTDFIWSGAQRWFLSNSAHQWSPNPASRSWSVNLGSKCPLYTRKQTFGSAIWMSA